MAAEKIVLNVKTRISISADRMPDGGIRPVVVFTSANPRCLSINRFPRWRDGHYSTVGGVLHYRGSTEYFGSPPENWLTPTSRPDRNTFIWQSEWTGATPTTYNFGARVWDPYHATVADATGGYIVAWAGSKRFTYSPYKVTYWQGKRKVKLICQPANKRLYF